MSQLDVRPRRRSVNWVFVTFAAIGTILLVLAFLVSIVEAAAFDPAYYEHEYAKNGTAQYVGVPEETLNEATENLLRYLEGDRENLDMSVSIDGIEREYYNEREKLHMADVRDLNQNAVRFMWTGYIAGGALLAAAYFFSRRKYLVWAACFFAIVGVLAAFLAIGIWGAIDFTSFWIRFHHIFFRNDLWTFDPATSLLIRMFEEQFFLDLVGQILIWFLSGTAAVLVFTGFLAYKGKRRSHLAGDR